MFGNEPSPEIQSLQRTVTSLNNNLNRYESKIFFNISTFYYNI